ncbi:hypothetical protein SAMN05421505_10144 [Sinosporangium album]|uniref:Uncharacterized protein n=1 Tax=Sinosporangium album TaxID=504805 RepID=A0A1G7QMC8_9ACTN|nr:hypothetical protein [Sinosporangium album]SDF99654.1 hypothetical protein SAMN05421505_10144 [Sinosporangium album]
MTRPADISDKDVTEQRAWPQLGDVAIDSAQNNRMGVIIGLPGEAGSDWLTYRLQVPGGGITWSAAADASTLRKITSQICHATAKGKVIRDEAGHWTMEIQFHYDDGSTHSGFLIVGNDEAQELGRQFSGGEHTR